MKKTVSDAVLTHIPPMAFYRAADVAREMHIPSSTASNALRELSRGGLMERITDKRRVLYLNKQNNLFR